jgi:MinD-like ATPase involved in chromosome partitioning or flagellar assembly
MVGTEPPSSPEVRTVLITLIAPDRTVDLVVDADTPVGELMASLLAAGGIEVDGARRSEASWMIAVMGREPIPPDQTLEAAEVLDGAVLVLRQVRGSGDGGLTPLSAPATGSPLAQARALLAQAGSPPELVVAEASRDRSLTVAVLSPKGGVGKTTLTLLLGELLCRLRSGVCLALDGDGDFGSLGRIQPAGFDAAVASRDGGIFARLTQGAVTFSELDRRLWKLPGGLRVVPSPRDPSAMARTDRAAYTRVIGTLQRLAETVLVDCGTGLGQPGVQAAVLASDLLVLVSDLSLPTSALCAETGELLARSGRPIIVVANHGGTRGSAGELDRLDRLFPWAAALVELPHDPALTHALDGRFELAGASRRLLSAGTELLALLALLCRAG